MPPVTVRPDASRSVSLSRSLHKAASCGVAGFAQIRKLVAEIPRPKRRMTAQAFAGALGEESTGRAAVPDRRRSRRRARSTIGRRCNRAKAAVRRLRIERPFRQPVHAAHVPAKQRRHRSHAAVGNRVHHRDRIVGTPCVRLRRARAANASHMRKKRTTSNPSSAVRAMSSRISPRSNRCHAYMALRLGQ